MSELSASQFTLREINAKLRSAGLDIVSPEQIKNIEAYTSRARFVQAIEEAPANANAIQFLRNIIARITAPSCAFHVIRPPSPPTSGHLFHVHPAGQSERSDAGLHC